MRTRRVAELALAVGATAVVLALASDRQAVHAAEPAAPVSWQGLVGGGPRAAVSVGQRMIVVLKSPSLAERVAAHGGVASDEAGAGLDEQPARAAAPPPLAARGAGRGDPSRVQLHARSRRASRRRSTPARSRCSSATARCRASIRFVSRIRRPSRRTRSSSARSPRPSGNADLSLPGLRRARRHDCASRHRRRPPSPVARRQRQPRRRHRGSVRRRDRAGATRRARRTSSATGRVGRHPRRRPRPGGLTASRRGANVLPIRVAGWQPDGQRRLRDLLAHGSADRGLERAVDPNDDGDATMQRASRWSASPPRAGFADDPAARAVARAVGLDTLVVAPAGNDGPAGPGFGSISGPGGAPGADRRGGRQRG